MGFKLVRGSKEKKGVIEASKQMVSTLRNDERAAIMVNGPSEPPEIVKEDVIKIAKLSGR